MIVGLCGLLVLVTGRFARAGEPPPWPVLPFWAALVVLVVRHPAVAAGAAAGLATVILVTTVVAEHRRTRVSARSVADALESLARALRGGASPRQALADVARTTAAPIGDDLRALDRRAQLGIPLSLVFRSWGDLRPADSSVRTAGIALAFAVERGGSAARAIDDVADTVRARDELDAEVRALASQARVSAALVAVLPLGFAGLASITDPQTIVFLFGNRIGRLCLTAGLVLDVVGWWWMQRIVRNVQV